MLIFLYNLWLRVFHLCECVCLYIVHIYYDQNNKLHYTWNSFIFIFAYSPNSIFFLCFFRIWFTAAWNKLKLIMGEWRDALGFSLFPALMTFVSNITGRQTGQYHQARPVHTAHLYCNEFLRIKRIKQTKTTAVN